MHARLIVGVMAMVGSLVLVGTPAAANSPSPEPTSAIGNETVYSLAVSPNYMHTGLVVAMATPLGTQCSSNCTHLWMTHDGGAHWAISPANGWNQGRPVIADDGKGHDVLYAIASGSVQRSDDAGATWRTVGGGGLSSTPAPTYAKDGTVAVTGTQDYVIAAGGTRKVDGSSGAYTDFAFAFSPSFPSGGAHSPAILSAIDNKTHIPVVQQCDASLHCTGASALPGATNQSSPATVVPSPRYEQDGAVFVQSAQAIYKSTDGAVTFAPLNVAPANGATATSTPALALSPGYQDRGPNQTAYAAVLQVFADKQSPHTAGGVFRSDDGGASWRTASAGSLVDGGAMSVAVAPDGRVFAGYMRLVGKVPAAGLLCSTDGASWQSSCPAVGDAARATSSQQSGSAAGVANPPGAVCRATDCATRGPANSPTVPGAVVAAGGAAAGAGASHSAAAALPAPSGSGLPRWMTPAGLALILLVGLGVRRLVRRRAVPSPPLGGKS
ncbi:MAG TPA: hypothetical protein VGQ42_16705 [Candidatus Dormibacteraeota bacterium]|jgi:hypothetical protein|nr:hypothetical protein [Candidatus Dormibacteraeota bacterium]